MMMGFAMTHASVSDPLSNLADAIEEYTRRQLALLERVRTLRAFLDPALDSDGTGRAYWPMQTAPAIRGLQPPPPPPPRVQTPIAPQATVQASPPPPPPVQMPPPPPRVQTPIAPQATVQASPPPPPPVQMPPEPTSVGVRSSPGVSLRSLKRDYDYFSELDAKLAQLGPDLNTHEDDCLDRWTEESGI
jgi:hypothetical protein